MDLHPLILLEGLSFGMPFCIEIPINRGLTHDDDQVIEMSQLAQIRYYVSQINLEARGQYLDADIGRGVMLPGTPPGPRPGGGGPRIPL